MDFIHKLDLSKLVYAETILSFAVSPFVAPPYNLPIFLFGTYAQENRENLQSLQTFTGLLGVSALFDIVWLSRNEPNRFIGFLTFLLLILKVPTFLALFMVLRERGLQLGGLVGSNVSRQTVWPMPGGFTSDGQEGYQNTEHDGLVRSSWPSVPVPPIPGGQTHATPGTSYQV